MIKIKNISKVYKLYKNPKDRLIEAVIPFCSKRHVEFFALRDVSFDVAKGDTIGIIGKNGSGKSTLLKILSKVITQSSGEIVMPGRVRALLELGAGFNPEYTGIENIYLNGIVMGFTRNQIKNKLEGILEFAEIGDYINQSVKTYSSGMFMRLAFALAISADPDILLVDEALAVGDYRFQAKCYKKFEEFKQRQKTIFFVSHDVDAIRRFCTKAAWINEGALVMFGSVNHVTSKYMEFILNDRYTLLDCEQEWQKKQESVINRFGSSVGSIEKVQLNKNIFYLQDTVLIKVELSVPVNIDLSDACLSISVKNKEGLDLFVTSTTQCGVFFNKHKQMIEVRFENYFTSGEYSLAVALENRNVKPISYYDYVEGAAYFKVIASEEYFGLVHPPSEIKLI